MKKNDLLDQLTEDIIAYVMHGEFSERELAKEIKPDGLDERFDEYELLMDLHFILKPEVVRFVEELPHRLRRIKTQTRNVSRKQRGGIQGRINWSETIKQRYSEHPGDRSLFICDNRTENYDIPENLVLKRLLSVIHRTLKNAGEYLEKDYEWVTDRWKEEGELIEEFRKILERNVHVTRIREPDAYEPTDRMLSSAKDSRQEIYQEAADLLETRRSLFEGDPDEIASLLDNTAITPDDEETLFELFVLFRFISIIDHMRDERFTLKTISSGKQEVANMVAGGQEIRIYHDSSAGKDISFLSDVHDKDEDELSRTERVQKRAHRLLRDYFRKGKTGEHTGRPDIIVLEVISEEDHSYEYLITEIKNSSKEKTIYRGIKETLEYLAFLRVGDEFEHDPEDGTDIFGPDYSGMLVIDDIEDGTETLPIEEQETIKILQASDLVGEDEQLTGILEQVIR